MNSQIINLEKNKFLKPDNYKGLSGEWILGKGVYFNSISDAEIDLKRNGNENLFKYALSTIVHNGKEMYCYCMYQVWD